MLTLTGLRKRGIYGSRPILGGDVINEVLAATASESVADELPAVPGFSISISISSSAPSMEYLPSSLDVGLVSAHTVTNTCRTTLKSI